MRLRLLEATVDLLIERGYAEGRFDPMIARKRDILESIEQTAATGKPQKFLMDLAPFLVEGETPVVRVGGLEIDVARRAVTWQGRDVALTPKEFELLALLARHAGKVLTHKQILTAVWGPAHERDTQYLRVYVGQLRSKIEPNPSDPQFLLTEPGIGYRLADTI